jgi:hypothetical protein
VDNEPIVSAARVQSSRPVGRVDLDRPTPSRETQGVPRVLDVREVREFKAVPEFKDGWYYRLTAGYPWIGPFATEHVAGRARAHVTSHVSAEPQWLKISTSVALGRLYLIPPRGAAAPKMTATIHRTAPTTLPVQANGYQARPRLALAARREIPTVRDVRATPQPAVVPRRRGSRTAGR